MTSEIVQPVQALMQCSHCHRNVGLLHAGSGPMLCCECVRVHRRWEWLGGNEYCEDEQHNNGQWCPEGIAPIWRFANNYATRSGVAVTWLAENGREVRTCDCNDKDCEGLQMGHVKDEDKPWGRPSLPYPKEEDR